MSMQVMKDGANAPVSFISQRLAHRRRLLRIFLLKNEETRRRLLLARGALKARKTAPATP